MESLVLFLSLKYALLLKTYLHTGILFDRGDPIKQMPLNDHGVMQKKLETCIM